jgi:catechol 2,3-dioxygenase-like lactoylglutathione lyase family enzyme
MYVVGLDHVVVNTEDVAQAIHFYRDVLRLEILRREEFRAGTVSVPSARVSPETIIDIRPMATGARVPPNMDHYCLVVGAQGYGQQFKRWDPDGNTIELRWSIGSQGA